MSDRNKKRNRVDEEWQPNRRNDRADETEEWARIRKQEALIASRAYMQPREHFVVVRQATNFSCSACNERDFPTIPSLVWHQRTEHSMQLSQFSMWIHCSGCNQEFASLSAAKQHIKAAPGRKASGCDWSTATLAWQVDESSEEATRFRAGLPPIISSTATASWASFDDIKLETIDEDGYSGGGTTCPESGKKRRHHQRTDRSYMLPRNGHVIVRLQEQLVCQTCGEGGFMTCSSLDNHMRKDHKAGIHQAGMWMHCARCTVDFTNLTSTRTHLAAGVGGDAEPCGWPDIYMCWHELERAEEDEVEEGAVGTNLRDVLSACTKRRVREKSTEATLKLGTFNASKAKRFRKLYKPPSQAADGYEIVKRLTDLPCFGCETRFANLTTFIWCMQGKHRLYFSDVGAWMECACGLEFTSTTALRGHLKADGWKPDCRMDNVSLCWQQLIGGRETQTPSYPGAPDPALVVRIPPRPPVYGSNLMKAPTWLMTEPSGTPNLGRVVKVPSARQAVYGIRPMPAPVPKPSGFGTKFRTAGPWDLNELEPETGSGSHSRDETISGDQYDSELDNMVKMEEEYDAGEQSPLLAEPKVEEDSIIIKEEEKEEETSETHGEASEEAGCSKPTFDPTAYEDGDRFQLRKAAQMTCRSCGGMSGTPSALAAHLRAMHPEDARGAGRDWPQQQWLECTSCCSIFHTAKEHKEHLIGKQRCSMADARLCWMDKEETMNVPHPVAVGFFDGEATDEDYGII